MKIVNYFKKLFEKDITQQIKEDLSRLDLRDVGVVDYTEVIPVKDYGNIGAFFDAAIKKKPKYF